MTPCTSNINFFCRDLFRFLGEKVNSSKNCIEGNKKVPQNHFINYALSQKCSSAHTTNPITISLMQRSWRGRLGQSVVAQSTHVSVRLVPSCDFVQSPDKNLQIPRLWLCFSMITCSEPYIAKTTHTALNLWSSVYCGDSACQHLLLGCLLHWLFSVICLMSVENQWLVCGNHLDLISV